jgi:uncharacterized protein YbjT (DUF2867 family)
LRHRGLDVLAASSRLGIDTITGQGLSTALADARVVVDVTNSRSFDDDTALQFFHASSNNLLTAAQAARIKHYIVLSIVGTDRLIESGYFRAKLAQEELVIASPMPHTILRSTQFYEFMPRIPEADGDGRTVRAAPALVQPLASAEVAAALADLSTAEPRNRMIEFAGPETFRLNDIVSQVMHAVADSRDVVMDPQARYFGARLREDTLTPDEGAILGVGRFADWLNTRSARVSALR